jgi:hypothetical protein
MFDERVCHLLQVSRILDGNGANNLITMEVCQLTKWARNSSALGQMGPLFFMVAAMVWLCSCQGNLLLI